MKFPRIVICPSTIEILHGRSSEKRGTYFHIILRDMATDRNDKARIEEKDGYMTSERINSIFEHLGHHLKQKK